MIKIAPLLTILALIVIFFLSFLPVSADRGNQTPLASPTPTPTPNESEAQPVPLLLNSQALAGVQTESLAEVTELRTLTSKHFQLGPNLYRAEISAFPIHYKDAAGNWQEIDTQPVARSGGEFAVQASNVKMVFPAQLQTGLAINGSIYPAAPVEQKQSVGSSQVKPDLATLFKDNPTVGKVTQNPPIELPLQWQPQHLAYASDLGSAAPFFQFAGMTARAVEKGVEYFQSLDNITLTFQPTALGFVQRLQFTVPPHGANSALAQSMTKLEYRVHIKLPANIQLYSQGVQQAGNFTTDLLELRDKAGNRLLSLPAPQLHDQTISRTLPQTHYRVERLPDGIALITELPLDWLNEPNRKYPVVAEFSVISPLALITPPIPFTQDTWIYECLPDGIVNPNVMWVGRFSGCNNSGIERALVQWAVNSLPLYAVIVDPTHSELWRLPADDTGGGILEIGTHRLLAPWDSASATWLSRANGIPWTQPGAENDYLTSLEIAVGVPAGGGNGYISMGSLESLVGAWHTAQYFGNYGDPNYGVLYKSTTEATPNLDRGFAQSELSSNNTPLLHVTYADPPLSAFIDPITPNTNFFTPRAPSPDYYRITNAPGWRAFGIRPLDGRSDYDLFLSTSSNFAFSGVALSQEIGSTPDFIVINPTVSASSLYPWAIQWEGTGLYYLRYALESGTLNPNGTPISNTAFPVTVLSIYQANLTAGKNYILTLDTTSGDADLGVALFAPTAAGGSNYMARAAAAAQSDQPIFGGDEEISYSPSVSGQYGVVVWNNGSTQNSNYVLSLQENNPAPPPQLVHLPITLKSFVPPLTNGGFELGSSSWISAGPGGPMVATVVPNPSPNCFAGTSTARLGTPGKLADGTIPIGEVKFSQHFNVPPGVSQLSFKYQAFSYDILKGGSSGRLFDRFEVSIDDNPVLTRGNPAGSTNGQTLWQSGCQTASINIAAFAGQNITLKFSVYNLVFPSYNTWAFVDNVQVQ